MSVPNTATQVTEHPGKMGVTVAASGQELEEDMQRKMKLWGVIKAFNEGRMPDNKQIDSALEYAIGNSPVDVSKLSPEGKVLIEDTRDILETMRMMVREKNSDELFQNAVWASYAGDPSRAKQDGVVPVTKEDAKKDVDQAAAHLRVLITLFITNSEFRKILNDLGFVGKDIFATTAAIAADKARPTQEQLDQIDQEAPSKQWIGADGQKLGTQDTPHVAVKGPNGSEVRYNPKDVPSAAKVTDTDGNARSAGEVYDQAQQAKQEAQAKKDQLQEQGKEQAVAHGRDLNAARDPHASLSQQKDQVLGAAGDKANAHASQVDANTPDIDKDEAANKARSKAALLKEKIPETHRAMAAEAVGTTKGIVKDALPKERRDQFIYRLKKVVVECQEHKDYMEAMTWLLDTLETYHGHAKHVASRGTDAVQDVKTDPGISDATVQFRTLLERFANGKPMTGITHAMDQIYTDAENDEELRHYFTRLNEYAHKVLLEPGWILDEECETEGRQIRKDGQFFFTDKYKGHQEQLFDEIQLWFTALADDPLNQRLGDDVKRLTKDLLFDDEGSLTFKGRLWKDVKDVILPTVIQQIGYVPIPRAEYSDPKIDLVIENLILSGPNLFPNVIELESHNRFTFSPYSQINKTLDTQAHKLRVGFSQIQADIRDVAFAFRRKSGFPRLSDSGLADVVIAGKGISGDVEIETVHGRRDAVFKINHINVKIDTLKFGIRGSKHDFIYKFIRTAATGVIKKAITVAMQSAIRTALEHAHDQLVEVRNTMDDAKRSDDTTRQAALKDLYARKKQNAKAKAAEAERKTGTFKFVTERDDQLNPDLTHDASKSAAKRLFKVEDLAASGKEWRSPAFDLLDPQHPAITGEHHPAATQGAGHKDVLTSAVAAAGGEPTAGAATNARTAPAVTAAGTESNILGPDAAAGKTATAQVAA